MVYQISERNQILIALFGIVVLCAGKLFKDYLNRRGYIEGMTVNVETTPRTLKRPTSGSTTNNTVFLNVTLSARLEVGTALTVTWPAAAAGANINLPTTKAGYTATNIVSSGRDIDLTTGDVVLTSSSPTSISFTHSAPINSGEWIRIAIKDISISASNSEFDLVFTVRESAKTITTTVNIGVAGDATSGGASDGQDARKNAKLLTEDNSNKRRMAQVNTYYTRHYEENTEVMKNIIYVSVALIILAVLRNKELIPASISTLGVILVLTLGGIVIGAQVFDIIRRNDHDFDKYDWNFNEEEMNRKQLLQQNANPANLSEMGMGLSQCYGPGCCDVGTIWDISLNKCVPSTSRVTGTAVWAPTSQVTSAGTLTVTITPSTLLPSDGIVTLTLPTGLFTGTPIVSGLTTTTATATSIVGNGLTLNAGVANSPIVITGLSKASGDGVSSIPRTITVKTSVDTNESSIKLTGI